MNRNKFLRQQNILTIVLQRLAVGLLLHLISAIQRGLDRTKLLYQFHRTFVPDSRRTGDVVDRVPTQRHHVDHALRRHTETLLDTRTVENQVVFRRIEDHNIVVDELHHVLVGRNHENLMAKGSKFARERADHIVGLETFVVKNRNTKCLKRPPNVRLLLNEVRRSLGSIRLVAAILNGLKCLSLDVELTYILQLRS